MNEEDIIVGEQAKVGAYESKPAKDRVNQDKEKLLFEGLTLINKKETKNSDDVLNHMFEKVRLYADLGFTAESKGMLADAEAYSKSPEYINFKNSTQVNQQSTDIHMNYEARGDKKLDPASILSSPL